MPRATLMGYNLELPSFRYRMRSLVAPLQAAGWQVRLETLPSGRYGLRLWERRALLRGSDVTVLHQIKLAAPEAALFGAWACQSIFDFDDAIYVRKPRKLGEPADDSPWRRRKFHATCRRVNVVAAGNAVLAGAARSSARRIEILPTALDVGRYRPSRVTQSDPLTIVWVGSPENLVYLEIVRPALARLSLRFPSLRLRVVCSRFPEWDDVRIDCVSWSPEAEIEALAGSHIGIMPLTDDEWARGKCAFKILQYMAASLPSVAAPVGANTEAVLAGKTGLHATSVEEWEETLGALLASQELRAQLGGAARAYVESRYSVQNYAAHYLKVFASLL